jgi:hypothetical protein
MGTYREHTKIFMGEEFGGFYGQCERDEANIKSGTP